MKRSIILLLISMWFAFAKADNGVIYYLNNIKIGEPVHYKNLQIFPILAKIPLDIQDYVTLDAAMAKGWLKIREAGSGEVNFVEVKNNGGKMVFMMTGEIVSGAKQDRMLKEDVLLPAKSAWIRVPVYCVEHGRWTSNTNEFKSEGLLAPNAVRERAKATESQSEVWDEIAKSQEKLGIAAATGTVRANYEDEDIQKELGEYKDRFRKIPELSPSTIGVVVVSGYRVICVDIFANNDLLSELWDKLLKSYCMDAIAGEQGLMDKEDIEALIQSLKDAKYVSTGTPGLGNLFAIESELGKGGALVYKSSVLHLDFFPDSANQDEPGIPLDFRRDQR